MITATPQTSTDGAAASTGAVLALVCIAQFLVVADDTIVNVALPSIARDLGFAQSDLAWVVNAYLLLFGGFLLLGGRLIDRFGARVVFVAGASCFAGVSLLAGLAPSGPVLVAARGAQGLAAATLSPAALALLLATFPDGPARARALGIWGAMLGVAGASGVLLGGVITELFGWRWIFLVNVPIALGLLVAVRRIAPPDGREQRRRSVDARGAALATAGLLALVDSVIATHAHGWGSTRVLAGLALSAVALAAFARREARSREPLLAREILRSRRIVITLGILVLGAAAMFSFFFFVGLYMQRVALWSPLRAGVSWLPFSFAMLCVGGGVMQWLRGRQLRPFLIGGSLTCAAGFMALRSVDADSGYVTALLPAMLVVAIGMGLLFIPVNIAATLGVGTAHAGLVSGLVGTAQQIGGAIGLAVAVTLASDRTSSRLADGSAPAAAAVGGYHTAYLLGAGLMLAAAVTAFALGAMRAPRETVVTV